MRYLLPVLLLLLSACADNHLPDAPCQAPNLEGRWRRLMPIGPDWQYAFGGGFMEQRLEAFGATITVLEYPYATRQDTIFIGGDLYDPARIWKIEFVGDSVLEVRNIHPANALGEMFWLRKME